MEIELIRDHTYYTNNSLPDNNKKNLKTIINSIMVLKLPFRRPSSEKKFRADLFSIIFLSATMYNIILTKFLSNSDIPRQYSQPTILVS